jgi:hypothetical protein
VKIWSMYVGLPVYLRSLLLPLVEGRAFFSLGQVVGPQRLGLPPHRCGAGDVAEARFDACGEAAPDQQENGDGDRGNSYGVPQLFEHCVCGHDALRSHRRRRFR